MAYHFRWEAEAGRFELLFLSVAITALTVTITATTHIITGGIGIDRVCWCHDIIIIITITIMDHGIMRHDHIIGHAYIVGHEFTVKHTKHEVVGAGQAAVPRQQGLAVDPVPVHRPTTNQRERDLGPKAGPEPKAVLDAIHFTALAEVEVPQFGVHFLVVGDGRESTVMQAVNHAGVLDADPHRMPGEPLRVGDEDAVRARAEGTPQGHDLGLG